MPMTPRPCDVLGVFGLGVGLKYPDGHFSPVRNGSTSAQVFRRPENGGNAHMA